VIFPIKLVYVAGPINAATAEEVAVNIDRGRQAGVEIWQLGAVAVVPHLNTLNMYSHDHVPKADIYLGDLEILKRCDAMLLLDGWESYQGVNYEVAWAKHRKIPIFHDLDELRKWLNL